MIKRRDRMYEKKKKSNDPIHISYFKKAKQEVQKKLRQVYWNYISDIVTPQPEDDHSRASTKRFWTFIKHKKKDNSSITALQDKGILHTEPKQKADILNQQFQSVFTEKTPISRETFIQENFIKEQPHPSSPEINITCNGVRKLLESLNPYKAAGPDSIKPKILKELSSQIAPILTTIFKVSLDTSQIPQQWKTANVQPIFKKGNKHDAVNYRPISLTCICCKLLEHIVTSNIMNHGKTRNILYPLQHGFRKGRSCETQLLEFTNDVTSTLEQGQQTDVLVMDFSKAFDKVSHSLLLHKLHHYGIRGKTNAWIQAFLFGRSQTVAVDGILSDPASVQSGVPQGSVLGPSLFLYYTRWHWSDCSPFRRRHDSIPCYSLQNRLSQVARRPKHLRQMGKDLENGVPPRQMHGTLYHQEEKGNHSYLQTA